jgi:protein arginine kinase activator
MRCEACGEHEAEIHLTEVVGDEARTVHLCPACAEERGVEGPLVPENFLLAGVLAQLGEGGGEGGSDPRGAGIQPGEGCVFCGMTLADFRKSGRLGCSHCWVTFETPLRTLVGRIHGAAQHTGKVHLPPDPSTGERERQLADLRRKLDRAVETEDFERAAELRDRIRALGGRGS